MAFFYESLEGGSQNNVIESIDKEGTKIKYKHKYDNVGFVIKSKSKYYDGNVVKYKYKTITTSNNRVQ